jgi:hypothetical protein
MQNAGFLCDKAALLGDTLNLFPSLFYFFLPSIHSLMYVDTNRGVTRCVGASGATATAGRVKGGGKTNIIHLKNLICTSLLLNYGAKYKEIQSRNVIFFKSIVSVSGGRCDYPLLAPPKRSYTTAHK